MIHETILMEYELLYLVGKNNEPDLEKIKEEILAIVIQEGTKFLDPQMTEERKLAYKIKRETRGIYVVQRFEIPMEDFPQEEPAKQQNRIGNITQKLNLNQNILRSIIVKADELPELKSEKEKAEEESKEEKKKTEAKKTETPRKQKEESVEDIDKKLEEILKI